MRILALDIGGANLKAAHSDGSIRSEPFDVWRRPEELAGAIAKLVERMPAYETLAVTMTAELCDCFETKDEGVKAVLDAVEKSLGRRKRFVTVQVWTTDGRLASVAEARAEPLKVAAANWLALAIWASSLCDKGPAMVIDVGSTTSDIVPVQDGTPVPRGRTDFDRLASSELVYSGIRRTPVSAIVRRVVVSDRTCRVSSELFATTCDVYTWLGDLPEEPKSRRTADGRPATRASAAVRLARVVCADRTTIDDDQVTQIARQIAEAQRNDLLQALTEVQMNLGHRASTMVLAGSGEFLARRTIERLHKPPKLISCVERFGPSVSAAACAYALTVIAAKRHP